MPSRKDDPVWSDVHRLFEELERYEADGWRVEFYSVPSSYPKLLVRVHRDEYVAEGRVYAHVQWMTVAEYWRTAYHVALHLIRKAFS